MRETKPMEQGHPELSSMRISYEQDELVEDLLHADPLSQFQRWLHDAVQLGTERIPEPNAMVISTVSKASEVHSRTVLLKDLSPAGLIFYTNYQSQKAYDLLSNPQVSALFPWYPLQRQVIVTGSVAKVDREQSEAYFATRPYKSQLGALVSEQSQVIPNREILEVELEKLEARYPKGSPVPMPEEWGGYLITVSEIEFWQGRRSRLHDRLKFVRKEEGGLLNQASAWQVIRLAP